MQFLIKNVKNALSKYTFGVFFALYIIESVQNQKQWRQ